MKALKRTRFALTALTLLTLGTSMTSASSYQLQDTFNTGTVKDYNVLEGWYQYLETDPNQPVQAIGASGSNTMGSYSVVPKPGDTGTDKALKLVLKANQEHPAGTYPNGDPKYKSRFEFRSKGIAPSDPTSTDTAERWYMFDFMIPTDWDETDGWQNFIVQVYYGDGSIGRGPSLGITLSNDDMRINGNNFCNEDTSPGTAVTTLCSDPSARDERELYSEQMIKGVWQRFWVHIKWSKVNPSKGIIELKRSTDGTDPTTKGLLFPAVRGVNTVGSKSNYFKIGNYLGVGWNDRDPALNKDKVMYYDNVRISKP
ncbi:hypothetical protein SY83_03025 [Paenibacillus swuensis]|uniref:Polysaccharide lyase n=1 Tax=Paenibacillus swuensis TaxID=1178515 RepID=A0A172TET1_9BACL|nr:heparin lyase I family protein [Paenibacillus swuensis]ANE45462.1 hypothetical protein SY83_03025 [Paenibacillus swuensis]